MGLTRYPRSKRRFRIMSGVGGACALLGLVIGAQIGISPASAAPTTYTADATSGTIVLKAGDPANERTISNPTVALSADIDDATGALNATATFAPAYTDTFVGPFSLNLYVQADLSEITPITGTVDPATGAITATSQERLAITVYNQVGATQNPSTDGKLTQPNLCFVDLDLTYTGTYDGLGGATINVPNFVIPQFTTAGCGVATDSLNQQLAGPTNSLSLVFAGQITNPTTTTTTTSTTAPSTTASSTTMPSTTTSTTAPPATTSSTTSTTMNESTTSTTGGQATTSSTGSVPQLVPPTVESSQFSNCTEAAQAGRYDIPRGDPDYASYLDGDNDGVACESTGNGTGGTGTGGSSGNGPSVSNTQLARTGIDSTQRIALALSLIAVGGAMVIVARRRRIA